MEIPEPMTHLLHSLNTGPHSLASAQVNFLLQDHAVLNAFMQLGYSQLSQVPEPPIGGNPSDDELDDVNELPRTADFERGAFEDSSRCIGGLKRMSSLIKHFVLSRSPVTFKEVAASLTSELDPHDSKGAKNIRRRVYDAINVLLAVNVLERRQHLVRWKATVPATYDFTVQLAQAKARVAEKRAHLFDVARKLVALRHLLWRNAQRAKRPALRFPFLFLSTRASAENSVSIACAADTRSLTATFAEPFQVFGDLDVLLTLNLHMVESKLVKNFLPCPELLQFLKIGVS